MAAKAFRHIWGLMADKQLSYIVTKALYGLLIYPLLISVCFAVLTGLFYRFFFSKPTPPWSEFLNAQSYRNFITVLGTHTGSYWGGLIGIITGVIRINKVRKKQNII